MYNTAALGKVAIERFDGETCVSSTCLRESVARRMVDDAAALVTLPAVQVSRADGPEAVADLIKHIFMELSMVYGRASPCAIEPMHSSGEPTSRVALFGEVGSQTVRAPQVSSALRRVKGDQGRLHSAQLLGGCHRGLGQWLSRKLHWNSTYRCN